MIVVLLQTCPQAVCSASLVGYTPLHFAIHGTARILAGQTAAAQQREEEEARVQQQQEQQRAQTEHKFTSSNTTVVVVRRLIEGNIAVVHIKDRDGETPLRHFCHEMDPTVHRLMVHARDTYNESDQEIRYLRQHPVIRQCWDTFQLLVKAAATAQQQHTLSVLQEGAGEREMVHAIVQNMDCLENFTFSLLTLKLCRDQLGQVDEKGDLPVHILSSMGVRPQRYEFKVRSSCQTQQQRQGGKGNNAGVSMNAMDLFLAFHKAAAWTPNRSGDLPLHLVLRNCAQWEDGVETLLRVYPAAVTVRDKSSGLYPFMRAAVDESASMTTLFRLIRFCPEFSRFADGTEQQGKKLAQHGCGFSGEVEEATCQDVLREFVYSTEGMTQHKRSAEVPLSSPATAEGSSSLPKRRRIF